MATIWVAHIGKPWFWPWRIGLRGADFAELEQKGIHIRRWRTLRCVPRREDRLVVLLGMPYGPPPHFDQSTFTGLSEILALHRSDRLKLWIIAPEGLWPPSDEPETDVWRKRCRPLLRELLVLRHPKSDSFCDDWWRTR